MGLGYGTGIIGKLARVFFGRPLPGSVTFVAEGALMINALLALKGQGAVHIHGLLRRRCGGQFGRVGPACRATIKVRQQRQSG
jgi:hypothetical protein